MKRVEGSQPIFEENRSRVWELPNKKAASEYVFALLANANVAVVKNLFAF